jgi:branched-chain amino acid transport system permease protein
MLLQYVLIGLALGAIYAIAASSLVVTFVSAGVLNFAFGAMAYVVARFYFYLNSDHHMPVIPAALLALVVFAPLLGMVLYGVIFRHLRGRSQLIKIVATIGLSVALPAIAKLFFGQGDPTTVPGLGGLNAHHWKFLGTSITEDQVITWVFLIVILVAGTLLLRVTDIGLRVRAMVDSEAMTSLSGTNPGRVALGVWAVTTSLAGLAGILVAPTNNLTPIDMTNLMAAAFAAVVVARLTSLPGAVAAGLAMGVVTDVIQKYLPESSSLTNAMITSVPFGFILIALIVYVLKSGSIDEDASAGGPLDRAIKPAQQEAVDSGETVAPDRAWEKVVGVLPLGIVFIAPLLFNGSATWMPLLVTGLCYAVTFLTFTLVTGEGGMLWLSQIIFAGVGALGTAQFVEEWHVPVLIGVVMAALVAAAMGAIIGLLTIRLGELYVGLATLTFGLLLENLIFSRTRFQHAGAGVILDKPSGFDSITNQLPFAYLTLAVFAILAFLTWNLRRSTSGMALRAVRDSAPASVTLGLSVVQIKVLVGAIAAFVAAVGGAFIAMDAGSAIPSYFPTFLGLVWLAVVVTMGVRSITAAALAGLAFAMLPTFFQIHLPARYTDLATVLFGLGAIAVAKNPEGVVLQAGRNFRHLVARLISPGPKLATAGPPLADGPPAASEGSADSSVTHARVAPEATTMTKAKP